MAAAIPHLVDGVTAGITVTVHCHMMPRNCLHPAYTLLRDCRCLQLLHLMKLRNHVERKKLITFDFVGSSHKEWLRRRNHRRYNHHSDLTNSYLNS